MVFGFIGYIRNKPYNCKPGGILLLLLIQLQWKWKNKIREFGPYPAPERVKSPGTSRICFLTLHPPTANYSTPS